MEKWDLYNQDRELIGKTVSRGEALGEGEHHIVVGIWTFNANKELLLTLRHPEKEYFPNMWENTGGCVLAGETSREGAVRELFEETGISVSEDELVYIGPEVEPGLIIDTYVVKADVEITTLKLQEGETVDAMWVNMDKFAKMVEDELFIQVLGERFKRIRSEIEAALN